MNSFSAALIAAALMVPSASAQAESIDLSGAWAFETPVYGGSCRLTGAMWLEPGRSPQEFRGRLQATQRCADYEARAEQSCYLRLLPDGKAVILSVIQAVEPESAAPGYQPDNFELDLVRADRREGLLRSASTTPTVFYRPDPAVS